MQHTSLTDLRNGIRTTAAGINSTAATTPDFRPLATSFIDPSIYDVAAAAKRLAQSKALGHDGLPTDILRAYPATFAELVHPLFAKVVVAGREPVAWGVPSSPPPQEPECGHPTCPSA